MSPPDPSYSTATVNVGIAAAAALADGGFCDFYGGTRPVNGNTAIGVQPLLASAELPDPAFGAPSGGTVTLLGVPLSVTASASGVGTWARIYQSDHTSAWGDCDVGEEGSGADIIVNSENFVQARTTNIISMTVTLPKSLS